MQLRSQQVAAMLLISVVKKMPRDFPLLYSKEGYTIGRSLSLVSLP